MQKLPRKAELALQVSSVNQLVMADFSKSAAVYLIKNIILCVGALKICEMGVFSLFSHYQDTIVESEVLPKFEALRAQPPIEDQTYYGTVFRFCRAVGSLISL